MITKSLSLAMCSLIILGLAYAGKTNVSPLQVIISKVERTQKWEMHGPFPGTEGFVQAKNGEEILVVYLHVKADGPIAMNGFGIIDETGKKNEACRTEIMGWEGDVPRDGIAIPFTIPKGLVVKRLIVGDPAMEISIPEELFAIHDLVPQVCLEKSTKTRALVITGQDGKLRLKGEWPTHRVELIVMGMRITIGEGKDGSPPVGFFNDPPKKLEMPSPSPGFTGGMLSPEWFDGAVHIFTGKATINQYEFQGEMDYPLTFKVAKGRGYVHICGKGTVTPKGQQTKKLGDKEIISYWLKLSTSEDELIREGCAQALGYLVLMASPEEKKEATNILRSFLTDKSYEVRRNAIEGIVRIGAVADVAADLKEMSVNDEDEWVRTCAIWAIEHKPNK